MRGSFLYLSLDLTHHSEFFPALSVVAVICVCTGVWVHAHVSVPTEASGQC